MDLGRVTRTRVATFFTHVAVIALVGAIVISFVPAWPFALLEHFRVHYAVTGIGIVAAAFAFAPRGWFDVAAIALLIDACVIVPDLGATRRDVPAGTPVRILFANVLTSNANHAALRELIAREQPDLVALVEIDDTWVAALAPALAGYPGRIEAPREDNFGIALYARGTLNGAIEYLGSGIPTIVAGVELAQTRLSVLVLHPLPPIHGRAFATQQRHFAAVAARVRALAGPVVIAGDLNTTPWSRLFARLIGGAGLCDSRAGFGYQGTFPASSTILRIPIDHVLVSCAIGVRDRRVGPAIGSDHFPVIVDLVVP